MTHNQLPSTEQQPNLLPHEHMPERLRDLFAPGANPELIRNLAVASAGPGEDEILRRYAGEIPPSEGLKDLHGLVKAIGSEDTFGWGADHRDAALNTMRTLSKRLEDMPGEPLIDRVALLGTYLETMSALPDNSDPYGAAYSLYEAGVALPEVLGVTANKRLARETTKAVLTQWQRLLDPTLVNHRATERQAMAIFGYDPEEEDDESYAQPSMHSSETQATTEKLIGELREYLYSCGDERVLDAARQGDIEVVANGYAAAVAPTMCQVLRGKEAFLQHRLMFNDAPGFYRAIAESFGKEWELQQNPEQLDDEMQDEGKNLEFIAAEINAIRDTSVYNALDLFALRSEYELTIDPYAFLEGKQQEVTSQAIRYDAFVDRLRALQDTLGISTGEALRLIV